MSNATQTIRTGMAVLGNSKITSYTLEFLADAGKYQAGKLEQIVVPYIEMGRAATCAVQFYDDTPTVSRKHAYIKKDGDSYFLDHLSTSNPTLLNGKVVNSPTKLNNGDEIKLSYEGPKMRFNSSGATKVGFTKRINLVAKQAIKPYKTTLITVVVLFVCVGVLGAFIIKKLSTETKQLSSQTEILKEENQELKASQQQLQNKILSNKSDMESRMKETVEHYEAQVLSQKSKLDSLKTNINPDQIVANALESVKNSVLYVSLKNIKVELDGQVIMDEPQPNDCHCTAFLLDDGKLVTARHCINFHAFEINDITVIANNGGNVTYEFVAMSPDKNIVLEFTNHDMMFDNSEDEIKEIAYEGQKVLVSQAHSYDGRDWAFMQSDIRGTIAADADLSEHLNLGTVLHCLGYTYGSTYQDIEEGLAVLYSKASVAKSGLDNNTIMVSGYSFDHGNSGGPLFAIDKKGRAVAVGVVSAGYEDPGSKTRTDALGSVIPISNLLN
jgi:pSer/pThr/pTyr-binding forkhead associated (FHA) protein